MTNSFQTKIQKFVYKISKLCLYDSFACFKQYIKSTDSFYYKVQ